MIEADLEEQSYNHTWLKGRGWASSKWSYFIWF